MLQRITSEDLDEVELVPQAILSLPISYFAKKYGELQKREDDFDIYEGAEELSLPSARESNFL
jgi:hypothetical protein